MRGRRWEQAALHSVADPTPLYPFPTNYDIQVYVDRVAMYFYIGPARKLKDPNGRFDHANIALNGGFIPNLSVNWTGGNKLRFKIQSKGLKNFQIDYLDANDIVLGSRTHTFMV